MDIAYGQPKHNAIIAYFILIFCSLYIFIKAVLVVLTIYKQFNLNDRIMFLTSMSLALSAFF